MITPQQAAGPRAGRRLGSWSAAIVATIALMVTAGCTSSHARSSSLATPAATTLPVTASAGGVTILATPDSTTILSIASGSLRQATGRPVVVKTVAVGQLQQAAAGRGVVAAISSDETALSALADSRITYQPLEFLRTRLQLVVAPGDPKAIQSLSYIRSGMRVGALSSRTLAGQSALVELAAAQLQPASVYPTPAALIAGLHSGQIDAGLLEIPDVVAAGSSVRAFDLPDDNGTTGFYLALSKVAPDGLTETLADSLVAGPASQALISASYLLPDSTDSSPPGASSGS